MGSPDDREVGFMFGTSVGGVVRKCEVDDVTIMAGIWSRSGDMVGTLDEGVASVGKGVALVRAADVIDEVGVGVGSPNGHVLGFMVGAVVERILRGGVIVGDGVSIGAIVWKGPGNMVGALDRGVEGGA